MGFPKGGSGLPVQAVARPEVSLSLFDLCSYNFLRIGRFLASSGVQACQRCLGKGGNYFAADVRVLDSPF
jgi:hypothetical protein